MNGRLVVVGILGINVLLLLIGFASVSSTLRNLGSDSLSVVWIWAGLTVLSLFLVGYWSYVDDERLSELELKYGTLNASSVGREAIDARNESRIQIIEGLNYVKYQPMISRIVDKYHMRGYLNAELMLEAEIRKKMSQGKSKEEAIEEIYRENEQQNK